MNSTKKYLPVYTILAKNSLLVLMLLLFSQNVKGQIQMNSSPDKRHLVTEKATFAGGCFWCLEAIFQDVEGVQKVVSGYSGGTIPNPDYELVCTGTTGHAEAVQITYNPAQISYNELLEIFFQTHDPTTLNRQGNDEGTQYRSVVFYNTGEEKKLAEQMISKLNASGSFKDPIVTEVVPLKNFYRAEGYHQDYYKLNPNQPYCRLVIHPKLKKFKHQFQSKLKK